MSKHFSDEKEIAKAVELKIFTKYPNKITGTHSPHRRVIFQKPANAKGAEMPEITDDDEFDSQMKEAEEIKILPAALQPGAPLPDLMTPQELFRPRRPVEAKGAEMPKQDVRT